MDQRQVYDGGRTVITDHGDGTCTVEHHYGLADFAADLRAVASLSEAEAERMAADLQRRIAEAEAKWL